MGSHPRCIKARATRRGARPSPATQCTAILTGCFYCLLFYVSILDWLLSCILPEKKSSTIFSHYFIIWSSGTSPSLKIISETFIPTASNSLWSYVGSHDRVKCLTLYDFKSYIQRFIDELSGADIIKKW